MVKRIYAYKNYFSDFYETLSQKEKDKVDRVLVLMHSDNRIPAHYIKPLFNGIYELRISTITRELRILFTYDGDKLIILFNCFVKKTQKIPRSEIDKAIVLRKQYYEEKRQG